MKQILRSDQAETIAKVEAALSALPRGERRVCVRAPTGYGKTTLMAHIAERAAEVAARKANGATMWVVVHRHELAKQAAARLEGQGIPVGIIKASRSSNPGAVAQVVSVDTIARRLQLRAEGRVYDDDELPPPPAIAFFDECHHIIAASWGRVADYCGDAVVVGMTATPWGPNGVGLPFFRALVEGPHPRELIGPGLPLVEPDIFTAAAPDLDSIGMIGGDFDQAALSKAMNALTADVVETWLRLADGKRTICFAVNVAHSKGLVAAWKEKGVQAEHVDDQTPEEERAAILARLRACETKIVSNVAILTEGFDAPAVECCVLARATKSVTLYLQAIGRALRASGETKTSALVLDHGRNAMRHGHPFMIRPVTLADGLGKPKRVKEKDLAEGKSEHFKLCPTCLRCCGPKEAICPFCGLALIQQPKVDTAVSLVRYNGPRDEAEEKKEKERIRRAAWYELEAGFKKRAATPKNRPSPPNADTHTRKMLWAASFAYKQRFGIMPHEDTIFRTKDEKDRYWAGRRKDGAA